MAGLTELHGQTQAVEILRTAIAGGKAHHAYLFEGPEGVGKARCARAFAMALNCAQPDRFGCGQCPSCQKILAGNHPDVRWFDMTPKGLTERVRELVSMAAFRPHEGRARVVVLDPADDLAGPQERAEPANVLLKTLEEPPADTHFVLVTAEPRRLPVTVRSRCQRIRFQPLSDTLIETLLVESHGATPAQARAAAALGGGSLGRAVAELGQADEGDGEASGPQRARAQVENLLQATRKGDPRALFDAAAELDREQARATLEQLATVLRDALLVREGLHEGRVSPARADFAAQLFGDKPAAMLLRTLAATDEATAAVDGNVAPALAIEHLLLNMTRTP